MNLVSTLLAAALALAGTAAQAQSNWPADKPLTMIVPFPPGGVADTVARPVAEALGKELRQTVVVENRAGAGGATGIGAAARVPATRSCCRCRRSRSCPRPTSCSSASRSSRSTSSSRSRASPPTRRCSSCAPRRRGRRSTSSCAT
jgi:Tripartite tricarboxylate transporter family receptor